MSRASKALVGLGFLLATSCSGGAKTADGLSSAAGSAGSSGSSDATAGMSAGGGAGWSGASAGGGAGWSGASAGGGAGWSGASAGGSANADAGGDAGWNAGGNAGANAGGSANAAGSAGTAGAGASGAGPDAGTDAAQSPCSSFVCDSPPPNVCNGETLVSYSAQGVCRSPGGSAQCSYASTHTDCTQSGQDCIAAACRTPVPVGFCRVQFPDAASDVPGARVKIYGRVYVAGVTDQSDSDDLDPRVLGAVGYGAPGTEPATWTHWNTASPNLAYGPSSPDFEANNDEYQASLDVPPAAPGLTYNYAFRFSGDGGRTWRYCDAGNAGSSDGFDTPGVLTVVGPYFSQYIEGSGNNKAIEIYNPGSAAFSLSDCDIKVYSNGSTTATNIALTSETNLAPGAVYAVCNTNYALADAARCTQTSAGADWSGNDAVALACGPTVYDVIGQIGDNPPSGGWGTSPTSTLKDTLLRQCSQQYGDINGYDAFNPALEWQGYPRDSSFLGSRNCPLP